MSFNPQRLQLLRERRSYSRSRLALDSGVSERSLRQYEAGDAEPRSASILRLARTLRVAPTYFDGPDLETLGPTAASFRAATKLPKYRQRAALAAGAFAIHFADFLYQHFDLPAVDIPDLDGIPPISAAEAVRSDWGLGNGVAPNLIHLLESHGVLCFALAEDCREFDAFSFWQLERPFVMLNTIKSGERGRWDAAHELGHLVLHRYEMTMGRQHELEADIFAQSFLLPPKAILASGLYQPSLHRVLEHKLAWQVSAIAFTRCLHGHNLLSDWHYRNLVIELSKRDYRSREPGGISRETSQLLPQALRHLAADGIRLPQIAESLDLPHSDLYEMMFSLVPVVAVPPAIDSR